MHSANPSSLHKTKIHNPCQSFVIPMIDGPLHSCPLEVLKNSFEKFVLSFHHKVNTTWPIIDIYRQSSKIVLRGACYPALAKIPSPRSQTGIQRIANLPLLTGLRKGKTFSNLFQQLGLLRPILRSKHRSKVKRVIMEAIEKRSVIWTFNKGFSIDTQSNQW